MAEGGFPTHLECSICLENFKQPKFLPCHHTFCAPCLEKHINNTKKGEIFECPLCRRVIGVPAKGVNEFQTNFYIGTDVVTEQSAQCAGCSDGVVVNHYCLDCEENFCSRCTQSHRRMKISRGHKLIEIVSSDSELNTNDDRNEAPCGHSGRACKKHPEEELSMVCKRCDQFVCGMCVWNDHAGHKMREIAEEAKEVRQKLETVVEEKRLHAILAEHNRTVSDLSEAKVYMKSSHAREMKAIDDHFARLKVAVNLACFQLKEKFAKEHKESLDDIESLARKFSSFLLSLNSLATSANLVLYQASDIELIANGDTLHKKLLAEMDNAPSAPKEIKRYNVFKKGTIDVGAIQKMMGSVLKIQSTAISNSRPENIPCVPTGQTKLIENLVSDATPTRINDRLVKVCTISASGGTDLVYDIAPICRDSAWVCFCNNRLEKVDTSGRSLVSVDLGTKIYSITSDENDNCIFSCPDEKRIDKLRAKLSIVTTETFVRETDGIPNGVAYRKRSDGRDEVLFSCRQTSRGDSAIFVSPLNNISSKAKRWSSGYQCVLNLDVDRSTNNVCISDTGSKYVHILDENGQHLSRYPTSNMYPVSVCFDTCGGILIAEHNSPMSHLHRIQPDGTFIETLADVKGLSIAVDRNRRMWVGKDKGVIDIYELTQ